MAKAPTEIRRFYVYRILGEMGETVYIGKGTGRRLSQQKRRFKADGEIMERLSTEKSAYRRERELIAEHNPPLNKSTGGNGSNYGKPTAAGPPLYSGAARLIRRMDGLEQPVKEHINWLIQDIASRIGPDKFAAGLRPHGINLVFS